MRRKPSVSTMTNQIQQNETHVQNKNQMTRVLLQMQIITEQAQRICLSSNQLALFDKQTHATQRHHQLTLCFERVRHTNDTSVDQTDCVCLMPE
jgi:hypothetical protein